MHRYYFADSYKLFFECVWADSFIEAKQKAFLQFSSIWNNIECVNPDAAEQDQDAAKQTIPVVISA
tara:strand:- start:3122 stop:3319 length:198 start_codon:yes stop_codon:yes gene_type:complete